MMGSLMAGTSKAVAEKCIARKNSEASEAKRQKDKVEHGGILAWKLAKPDMRGGRISYRCEMLRWGIRKS
jgi:hypothetical protein